MVTNLNTKIFFILVVLVLAGCVLYFEDITLGLDLSGGSSLRYRLPEPDVAGGQTAEQVLDETVAIFRKRLEGYGLKEIPIRAQGNNEILIQLPGMSEAQVDDIKNIIKSQGQLEWILLAETETDDNDDSISVNLEDEQKRLIEYLKTVEAEQGGWDLNVDLSSLNFTRSINGYNGYYRWMAYNDDTVAEHGRVVPEPGSSFASLGMDVETQPGDIAAYFELVKKFEDKKWQFAGHDLRTVYPDQDRNKNPAVGFAFKPDREADFGEFTRVHMNKRFSIILDGRINSAPIIQSEISGPGTISGPGSVGFSLEDQKSLLTILRSGSLDVKPVLLSQNTIGPTLGENSINRGKIACFTGLGAIFVFLLIYYLFAGIVASLALAFNLILLMGVMVFLEATLTLPGIAGIALTVGMAVDANILIFERIREERDKGKTLPQAIKNGFERALITIVDANVTTFITGFLLFHFGTGPIKGFAATLMIGICTSLFAALLVSKVIFAKVIDRGALKDLKMLRLLRAPNVTFTKLMGPAAILSAIVIVAGLAAFFSVDQSKYGIDFTGGFNVQLKCVPGTTQKDIQNELGEIFPNVQVVSVREVGTSELEVFDIKIKSFISDEEALEAEKAALQTGEVVAGEAGEAFGSSQYYLSTIKEQLKGRLVSDPISNLVITPDQENQCAQVTLDMNLAEPATAETVTGVLTGLIRVDKVDLTTDGKQAMIAGVYTQGPEVGESALRSKIGSKIKRAADEGVSAVKLQDPFPLTGYIGPTVGRQLRDATVIAIFFALVAIIVYIRIRFKEYKYGFAAVAALVHDVLITLGAVAAARMTGLVEVEIDLPLIAAFLTIIGYSLNDTIVVFDRVRENLPRVNKPFRDVLNLSINQTLSRTVLTSITTLISIVILFALNYGQRNVLEGFSFAMIVGVIVGTYSSIFVASPVLLRLHLREQQAPQAK